MERRDLFASGESVTDVGTLMFCQTYKVSCWSDGKYVFMEKLMWCKAVRRKSQKESGCRVQA